VNFSPVWKTLQQIINGIIVAIPGVVIALAVFIVFFFVAKGIRFSIERLTVKRKRTRALGRVLGRVAQGSIVFLGLLVALVIIFPSFKPVDVINLLGISGVAIGFAFRDILQNFLAGILLLLTEPFRIGDQIIVTGFEGTVEDIQTRATMIRTYDGRRVVIPNAQLFTQSVIVNTAFALRRLEYDLDLDPSNNVERAKELILEAISSVQGMGILKEPAPDALVVALTANALRVRAC
jgi:small conductance mechanosensitive channel